MGRLIQFVGDGPHGYRIVELRDDRRRLPDVIWLDDPDFGWVIARQSDYRFAGGRYRYQSNNLVPDGLRDRIAEINLVYLWEPRHWEDRVLAKLVGQKRMSRSERKRIRGG